MGAACCCCCGPQNRNVAHRPLPPQPEQQEQIIPPKPEEVRAVDLLQTQKLQDEEERKKREAERLRQEQLDRQREAELAEEARLARLAEEEEKRKKELEEQERQKRLLAEEINRQRELFKNQLETDRNRDLNLTQSNIEIGETNDIEKSYEFDEQELLGPILIERVNTSVSSIDNLQEIQRGIEILQYLQPGTNSTNSFIIKYKDQKYFMKTFYGLQSDDSKTILNAIKTFQEKNRQGRPDSYALANYLKYLSYYHRESTEDRIKMSLISTVEEYNLYTFAADENIPLDHKIKAATDIIQAGRFLICNDTKLQLDFNLKYLKPSNILISIQDNKAKVTFSDWYYQLRSFNQVINQEDSFDPRYSSNIVSNYEKSGQIEQNQGQIEKELDSEQQASIKLLLVLIFFNLDLSSDVPLGVLNGYNDLYLKVQDNITLDQLFKSQQLKKYIETSIASKENDQEKYRGIWETLEKYGVETFYGKYK